MDLEEIASLRKDAKRYRWIRAAGAWESEVGMTILSEKPEEFDAEVDARMAQGGMTNDDKKLLPCPFCGNDDRPIVMAYHDCDFVDRSNQIDGFVVICNADGGVGGKGCGAASGWYKSEAEAIAGWNQRA